MATIEGEAGADGAAAGGAGSAADFLGSAGGGGEQSAAGGEGDAADAGDGEQKADAEADAAWLEQFSADGDATNPSHRDYLKSKGFKSLDDVAKSYREAEKALRTGGRIAVPGEGASDEERATYHKAIGVPDSVDGYAFTAPDGVQLDETLTKTLASSALKNGVPKAAFDGLAKDFVAAQLDQLNARTAALDGEAEAWVKAQGSNSDAQIAHINSAVRNLGLTSEDNANLRASMGPKRALDMLAKLGAGMAEDTLMTGGKGRFGVTPAEAQAEIDKLKIDTQFQKDVLVKGSAAAARWARLQAAIGDAADREAKAA